MKLNKIETKKRAVIVLFVSLSLLTLPSITTKLKRRYSVRPMNKERKSNSDFHKLVSFMKEHNHDQYFKYTRMHPDMFDHLLELIESKLKHSESRPHVLTPAGRLTMTLHYLAVVCSMQEIAWNFYVGKSTVHYVIKDTCQALWDVLCPIYLEPCTREDLLQTSVGFFNRWNMPNCLGAIDGKHVVIQAPEHSGSEFYNYKNSFSMVLMACCDAYLKFTMVAIGDAGSLHDSTILRNSNFGSAILNKWYHSLAIRPPQKISNSNKILPYFYVVDQAFSLHEHIMRPYPGKHFGEIKNVFNYRLSRARRTIENAFGILMQRWRILCRPILAYMDTATQIVKANVVLHNFVLRNEYDLPEYHVPTRMVDYEDINRKLVLGK